MSENKNKNTPNNMGTRGLIGLLISFLGLFVFFPGISLLGVIGMMPTIGARISDPTYTRAQTFCVGFCNVAGLVPSFYELYLQHFSLKAAYVLIHDQMNLLIILSASAFGWGLFFLIPSITISIYRTQDKRNLLSMIKRYDQIQENWGDSVPTCESIESSKFKSSNSSEKILHKKKSSV